MLMRSFVFNRDGVFRCKDFSVSVGNRKATTGKVSHNFAANLRDIP